MENRFSVLNKNVNEQMRQMWQDDLANKNLKINRINLWFGGFATFAAIVSIVFSIFVYFDNKQLENRVKKLEQQLSQHVKPVEHESKN